MAERFAGMTWQNTLLAVEKEATIPLSASLLSKQQAVLEARLDSDLKIVEGVKAALSQATSSSAYGPGLRRSRDRSWRRSRRRRGGSRLSRR